jgi:hypothetical protein
VQESTSVLMASTSAGDIGSGANSSATKLHNMRRINGSFNCGQTWPTVPTVIELHFCYSVHIHVLSDVARLSCIGPSSQNIAWIFIMFLKFSRIVVEVW